MKLGTYSGSDRFQDILQISKKGRPEGPECGVPSRSEHTAADVRRRFSFFLVVVATTPRALRVNDRLVC